MTYDLVINSTGFYMSNELIQSVFVTYLLVIILGMSYLLLRD